MYVNLINLELSQLCTWFKCSNVAQTEEPNIAEICLNISLLITVNNYKWTWHPCVGTPALARKCWSLQNNGGVKRVRPREGLGACFPLSSLLQASPQTSPRHRSPLGFGSVSLSTEVLEAAKIFSVPVSKSGWGNRQGCLMSPSVLTPTSLLPPHSHAHTHIYTKRERESC